MNQAQRFIPWPRKGRLWHDTRQSWVARLLFCICLAPACPVLAEFSNSVDADTGLKSWQWNGTSGSFTFNQQVPDQARAFFQGRGFNAEQSEPIAQNCLFGIIIRNPVENDKVMTIDLAQWRIIEKDGPSHPPRLDQDWQPQWQTLGVSKAARIAFRWALFPSRQTFQPGDWNMGLIILGAPPDTQFDLEVPWLDGDTPREIRFNNMRCGADRSL